MYLSSFKNDLEKEQRLIPFLNQLYQKHLKHYTFKRATNLKTQLKGVDLVFTHKKTQIQYHIDEKAQLDYINEDLPTFAFEIAYYKKDTLKQGWFFDTNKTTQFYALITGIYADEPATFTAAKITLVNRKLLQSYLANRQITQDSLPTLTRHGKKAIPSLDQHTEGYLYLSKNNKAEQPLNLILRLDFLLAIGVANRLV